MSDDPPTTGYRDVDYALARYWLLRYGPNDPPTELIAKVLEPANIDPTGMDTATAAYVARMVAQQFPETDVRTLGQYICLSLQGRLPAKEAADDQR